MMGKGERLNLAGVHGCPVPRADIPVQGPLDTPGVTSLAGPGIDGTLLLLGDIGVSMLDAISSGASEPWAIHVLTGVSLACIEHRLPVLERFDLVTASPGGAWTVTGHGRAVLACWRGGSMP